jgi:8-oxo-dGTP pyrophosphatase MutT (NUDIX family)
VTAPHEPAEAVRRRAARVILLDPDDRILLLHGHETADPTLTWWFTPGGGVEGDEDLPTAALREVAEETGITSLTLGPPLWQRSCAFDFDGRHWEQDETYFLARTTTTRVDTAGQTELERRTVRGLRWWTCDELSSTRETVYPTGLAELLRRLLVEGPPRPPLVLDTETD